MAFHRQVGPSTRRERALETERRDARDISLAFYRKLPRAPGSPGGVLRADDKAISEAFKLCHEALLHYEGLAEAAVRMLNKPGGDEDCRENLARALGREIR